MIVSQKKENALFGTQYGVTYQYKDVKFQLGFEVPLTGIYVGNNCYAAVDSTAEEAANQTNQQNQSKWSAMGKGINVDIKVNSTSGSIGYYIARVYKTPPQTQIHLATIGDEDEEEKKSCW